MSGKTNNMQQGYDVVIARIKQYVLRLRLAATKALYSDSMKIQNNNNTIVIVSFDKYYFISCV
jgi:hypothetical protein